MTYPSFAPGEVLRAQDMNAVGLWLVKSQTVGTGVSSVTVTGAFSADYDNYRIMYVGGTQSGSNAMYIKLGGSSTGYYGNLIFNDIGSTTVLVAVDNNSAQANWVGGGSSTIPTHASVDLFGPYLARFTKIRNGQYQNATAFGTQNGEHRVATSYTDFTLGMDSGVTFSGGTIRVYGYRNQEDMTRPLIQIDDEIREMTEEEYAEYEANNAVSNSLPSPEQLR